MNKGQFVADGTTEMLKGDKSDNNVTRITLEHINPVKIRKVFENLEGVSDIKIEETNEQLKVTLAAADDLRAEIYRLIKKEDWILLEMVQERKSLEHIFKELTKEV
jgi:ABC-type multidrug transport system ATPase subunit